MRHDEVALKSSRVRLGRYIRVKLYVSSIRFDEFKLASRFCSEHPEPNRPPTPMISSGPLHACACALPGHLQHTEASRVVPEDHDTCLGILRIPVWPIDHHVAHV